MPIFNHFLYGQLISYEGKFMILDGQHFVRGAVFAEGAGLPESGGGGQHGERAHERTDARTHRLSRRSARRACAVP